MATAQEYAQWIVDNQDQQGSEEFNTVARAYEMAKAGSAQQPGTPNAGASAVQTALPAVTGSGPTGLVPLSKDVLQAVKPLATNMLEAGKGVGASYLKEPIKGLVDVGAASFGLPPPYASAQGISSLMDKYNAAKGTIAEGSKLLSASELVPSPVNPATMYPGSVPAFREMQRAAPELAGKLSEIYQTGGGNNAVKAFLASEEGAKYMNNPQFAQAAEAYMGKVPGIGAQAMKVAGPVLRGLGRVAGPAGLALNAYDAAQYAQESQLGQRLAQGQGGMAQRNFRQMNPGYASPVSPDEAAAVLQNGSPRDIEAMGGQATLDALIKQKAAARVLGPVAPTGQ